MALKDFKDFIGRQNKYILVSVTFVVWLMFFDQNNWIQRVELFQDYKKLEQEKYYYMRKIKQDSVQLHDLTTNKQTLERFAREQYLMKKPNEDIFIIIQEEE